MARDAFLMMLQVNEGVRARMYLDTRENVTVGVGHLLSSLSSALPLRFVNSHADAASSPEIAQDFVLTHQSGSGLLTLGKAVLYDLLRADVANVEAEMRAVFPGYETHWPIAAQDAVLDMAFNLGTHRLSILFPHLCLFAREKDWVACAKECHRNGIGDRRNDDTMKLFLLAAK